MPALLIIDVINDFCFDGGEELLARTQQISDPLLRLRDAANAADVPVIYVNDNFDQWHSERSKLIEHCGRAEAPGRDVVERLKPGENDYFVIKPQFSGFYSTSLSVLLAKHDVRRLILTGVAADICVLFTAGDAHMRGFKLWVPRDCVAASEDRHTERSLAIMEKSMGAETRPTSELSLEDWLADED